MLQTFSCVGITTNLQPKKRSNKLAGKFLTRRKSTLKWAWIKWRTLSRTIQLMISTGQKRTKPMLLRWGRPPEKQADGPSSEQTILVHPGAGRELHKSSYTASLQSTWASITQQIQNWIRLQRANFDERLSMIRSKPKRNSQISKERKMTQRTLDSTWLSSARIYDYLYDYL